MMLSLVRVGLPLAIALAGIVCIVIGGDVLLGIGITLIGAAVCVVLANVYIRLSISSQRDRERDEERRSRGSGPRPGSAG